MIGDEWPTRDLVSHQAATTPEATAVVDTDTGTEWTYGEFDRRVDDRVLQLEDAIDGPIDRLGLLVGTRVEFAELYFAAMRRDRTVVPLNVRETDEELRSKVRRTDLDAIVCESATESIATDGAGCVCSIDPSTHNDVSSLTPPDDADISSRTRSDEAEGSPTEPATASTVSPSTLDLDQTHLLMFTSGSSGRPKAVRLTLGNLLASATASAFRLGVSPNDRWLCCLPPYHMGGLAPIVRSALYGTTTVIQRSFDPVDTAQAIDEYESTGVSLVPTMLRRLLEMGWTPPDSLRFVLLGGAPASQKLLAACRDRGVPVHPTYGMTETASQIATARPADAFAAPGTVGPPLSCTEVSIVDESGSPVDPGERGELVVSGPTVTPGYLDPDRTARAVGDRGFHTGDVGYRDERGRLWITGRLDDRIVTGGENVDPHTVVDRLRAHPGVDDAAVVGLDDPNWGQRVAALVVPTDVTNAIDIDALLTHCEDRLAGFKRPKTIAIAAEIPRTPSGTVDREAVRDRLRTDGIDVSQR